MVLSLGLNCATSSVGVAASNKPLGSSSYETIRTVDKTFKWYTFDIIIFNVPTTEPPIENLYEQLLEDSQADALVNIRYWNDKTVFGPLTRFRFSIKADAVKLTSGTTTPNKVKK